MSRLICAFILILGLWVPAMQAEAQNSGQNCQVFRTPEQVAACEAGRANPNSQPTQNTDPPTDESDVPQCFTVKDKVKRAACESDREKALALVEASKNECVGCAVAEAFLVGAMNLSVGMSDALGDTMIRLAIVIFIVWLMFQVAKMLLPFGPLDKSQKTLNLIATKLGIMMFIVVALQSLPVYERLMYGVIDGVIGFSGVILEATADYSGQVTEAVVESGKADGTIDKDVTFNRDTVQVRSGNDAFTGAGAIDANAPTEALRQNLMDNLNNQISLVQRTIEEPLCIGMQILGFDERQCFAGRTESARTVGDWITATLKQGWRTLQSIDNGLKYLSRLEQDRDQAINEFMLNLIAAFILIAVYGLIWLKYPLALLDVVLRWAVILVLWPVVVITLAFPLLRGTTVTLLKGFANACLELVFQAIIVGVVVSIVQQIVATTDIRDFALLASADSSINSYTLQRGTYIMIILCGFMMLHLMKQAPQFAAIFISSTMDTKVAAGIWNQVTTYFWIAADAATGGMTQARKVIPIK